jgi:hypothetical protein
VDRTTRNIFLASLLGLIAVTVGAVVLLGGASGPPPGTTLVQGVVIGVDSSGLTKVRGFTLRADDGRTLKFDLAALENAVEFPPGHLVEHQGLGSEVRVYYRDAGGTLQAIRLEDAPAGADVPGPAASARPAAARPAAATQPAGAIALIAASISAGDAISS